MLRTVGVEAYLELPPGQHPDSVAAVIDAVEELIREDERRWVSAEVAAIVKMGIEVAS